MHGRRSGVGWTDRRPWIERHRFTDVTFFEMGDTR